jgi:cytochrome c-type biogenesis protein CcmH
VTKRLVWGVLAVAVAVVLWFGTADREPATDAERVESLSEQIACPVCDGQSVRDSNAPVANDIRADVARRVADGQSDDEILAAMADSFGDDVLMNPPSSGTAALVWALPVVAGVVAVAGVGYAFWRWRAT